MSALTDAVGQWIDLPDPTEDETAVLAQRMRDADTLARLLKDARAALSDELAARLELDITSFPGIGVVHRGYTRRSEWRDENSSTDLRRAVGEAVTAGVALNIETGELDPRRRNIARATVQALYDIIPSFSSVKAPAKRYGIDIEDYRRWTEVAVVTVDTERDEA